MRLCEILLAASPRWMAAGSLQVSASSMQTRPLIQIMMCSYEGTFHD